MNSSEFDQSLQILLRLGAATLFCGVLGVDRDLHRKPAGIRVLALVGLGAAAISMGSASAFMGPENQPSDGVLRTIQGVLSGIGFLGAGVIMQAQRKDQVHGMATAASIWISAILGMICGLGLWILAVCSFGMAWGILVGGRWLEARIIRMAPTKVSSLSENLVERNKDSP